MRLLTLASIWTGAVAYGGLRNGVSASMAMGRTRSIRRLESSVVDPNYAIAGASAGLLVLLGSIGAALYSRGFGRSSRSDGDTSVSVDEEETMRADDSSDETGGMREIDLSILNEDEVSSA